MYLSGKWKGFWEQTIFGRQPMDDLELHFQNGVIRGQGTDTIGDFTFEGNYDDDGNVHMIKQYVERHRVLYLGRYDGEGTIFGQWSIGTDYRGPFAIAADVKRTSSDAPIQDIN